MGVKTGELNSRMGNMETVKEFLCDLRESMLSKKGGDKGGHIGLNVPYQSP